MLSDDNASLRVEPSHGGSHPTEAPSGAEGEGKVLFPGFIPDRAMWKMCVPALPM